MKNLSWNVMYIQQADGDSIEFKNWYIFSMSFLNFCYNHDTPGLTSDATLSLSYNRLCIVLFVACRYQNTIFHASPNPCDDFIKTPVCPSFRQSLVSICKPLEKR
jgi:hypothetical protein